MFFDKKFILQVMVALLLMLCLTSCSNNENPIKVGNSNSVREINLQSSGTTNLNMAESEVKSKESKNLEVSAKVNDIKNSSEPSNAPKSNVNNGNMVDVSILGKKVLSIDKSRIDDDVYGVYRLDNRWKLSEIDAIMNAIKGSWKIDEYVGFLSSSLYYPDLFDSDDNLPMGERERLLEKYNQKVNVAQKNVPQFYFSVKERPWFGEDGEADKETNKNYIYVNGNYDSPISIILSLDRFWSDYYPVFSDSATTSDDFFVEYPVVYIKFFIRNYDDNGRMPYEPATLVLSSDNQFYVLIDGAFYSLKPFEQVK